MVTSRNAIDSMSTWDFYLGDPEIMVLNQAVISASLVCICKVFLTQSLNPSLDSAFTKKNEMIVLSATGNDFVFVCL